MEDEEEGTSLGSSILYADLARQMLGKLHQVAANFDLVYASQLRGDWKRLFRKTYAYRQTLTPHRGCRTCEVGQVTARHYGETLADMLCEGRFQELYARCDGVCLPHLPLIVEVSRAGPGLQYLVHSTAQRLGSLQAALSRYAQKQTYDHHNEQLDQEERSAPSRAVAFFTGDSTKHSDKTHIDMLECGKE